MKRRLKMRPKGTKDVRKRKFRATPAADAFVGKKYNRWLVLEKIQGQDRDILFKMKCDCGYEGIRKYCSVVAIKQGKSISCGCYHSEQMIQRQTKSNNHAAKTNIFNQIRGGAKARNLEFLLTFNDVMNLVFLNCYYCECKPYQVSRAIGGNIIHLGIDRVDNDIGYILENCVPCCKSCNLKKREVNKNIIKKAYEFLYET